MVDEETCRLGLEGKYFFLSRVHSSESGSTTRTIDCVNIYVMGLGAALSVGQMKLYAVSHTEFCHGP